MNTRLRLLAWQIDVAAYEHDNERHFPERVVGDEARGRSSPSPALARAVRALFVRSNSRA